MMVHEVRGVQVGLTTRIASGKVRQAFAETINRVAYGRERIVLHRRGKDVAAVIPVEDLALLEEIEDRLDVREAEKVLAQSKARGEKPIPWEKAKKKLGL
jgi:prevent-host-death family protein